LQSVKYAHVGSARRCPLKSDHGAAHAQTKIARLSFLGVASATGFQPEALRAGLRGFGHVEGNNIVVEYRFAEGR
jgi:hypothetical protein